METMLSSFQAKGEVAAYCRVSTDSGEQMASLEAQKDHYESYIKQILIGNLQGFTMMKAFQAQKGKPNWTFKAACRL